MRRRPPIFLLVVALLAGVSLSCSRTDRDDGRALSRDEIARLNGAVGQYHSRMNQERFDLIWAERLPILPYKEEPFVNHLAWIRQKYGKVSRFTPVRAVAWSHPEETGKLVLEGWHEVEGEKGKYVENTLWHFIGGEAKLADHRLLQYDEQGQLYMTSTIGPNPDQTYKVLIGRIKRNVE
jgi:hypothetical protein